MTGDQQLASRVGLTAMHALSVLLSVNSEVTLKSIRPDRYGEDVPPDKPIDT